MTLSQNWKVSLGFFFVKIEKVKMLDDVLDGEVDTEKSVYCENNFEGGHTGFFQRGKPMVLSQNWKVSL